MRRAKHGHMRGDVATPEYQAWKNYARAKSSMEATTCA